MQYTCSVIWGCRIEGRRQALAKDLSIYYWFENLYFDWWTKL